MLDFGVFLGVGSGCRISGVITDKQISADKDCTKARNNNYVEP
jgi:hypothetical protein